MARPVYIAFEGAEGCGKSTQARRLAESLDAVLTRETGGTEIGQRLREILHDTSVTNLDDHAEALIAAADRAQHIAEIVRPALAAGRHVVSDRSIFSTLAYQGYGRGLPVDEVRAINEWAIGETLPDLVVLLRVPAEILAERMSRRTLDRFEAAGDDFHQRVEAGFVEMAEADPERWVTIDASSAKGTVTTAIREAVHDRLGL